MSKTARVLVVEDDEALRQAMVETIDLAGFHTRSAANGDEAKDLLDAEPFDLVISDVQMPVMNGHRLLAHVKAKFPDLPFVLVTAYGDVEGAVAAMRQGAHDYLVKPFEARALTELAERLTCKTQIIDGIIAQDPITLNLINLTRRVASSEVTVMISGESGTGKEVFARLIHAASPRSDGPFVAINCAAIPETMLESVLFGYEKGAFTGAYQSHPGKLEHANGGTLLLDEISEMDLSLQVKLLRVLQEKELERLGGDRLIPLDIRVLATTNRNLRQEVAAGRFREDLYYRLNVFPLNLPPLRERIGDIVPLAQYFLARYSAGEALQFGDDAERMLSSYPWPGNVRELENVIQRALILRSGACIVGQDIRFENICSQAPAAAADVETSHAGPARLGADLKATEQQLIVEALRAEGGSRKDAAARLGISPRTLRYKLARFREEGISIPGLVSA